jgi:hypothetical protein
MNVTFHTLLGLATAAVLASRQGQPRGLALATSADLPLLGAGFMIGIAAHGALDFAPHSYPIKSAADVLLSLGLFGSALLLTRSRHWLLLVACFAGCIFPDVVDLGPAVLNKRLGWSLPVVTAFPWHRRPYSGSIYDGSRSAESLLYHLVVAGASLGTLYAYGRRIVRGSTHSPAEERI